MFQFMLQNIFTDFYQFNVKLSKKWSSIRNLI